MKTRVPLWSVVAMLGGLIAVTVAEAQGYSLASLREPLALFQAMTGTSATFSSTVTAATVDTSSSMKTDSLQTHTGGATQLNIATTGTGDVLVGNGTSGAFELTGAVMQLTGGLNVSGFANLAQGSTNYLAIAGAAASNPVTVAATGTNAGVTVSGTGSGAYSFGNSGTGATTIGNSTGGVVLSGGVQVGGSTALTKWPAGTVAVTGASIAAGDCANQGAAITTTGAAAGQPCIVGLPGDPGNALTYSCYTGANSCQIVACNGYDGASLTSLTGTYSCRVLVP